MHTKYELHAQCRGVGVLVSFCHCCVERVKNECAVDGILFKIQMRVDNSTDQATIYMRKADKGVKICHDGNGGDGVNTAIHIFVPRYEGDVVIVAALPPPPLNTINYKNRYHT